jgi:hypothetical protein
MKLRFTELAASLIEQFDEQYREVTGKFFVDVLEEYIEQGKRREDYRLSVEESERVRLISESKNYQQKIETYQPSEPEHIKKYRFANFRNVVKKAYARVVNTVQKIFRSDGFVIEYEDIAGIPEEEQPSAYFSGQNEDWIGVNRWLARETLRWLFTEPNGLVLTFPKNYDAEESEFNQPVPIFWRADQIIYWGQLKRKQSPMLLLKGDDEEMFWVVTPEAFFLLTSTDRKGEYNCEVLTQHDCQQIPANVIGGIQKSNDYRDIFESFLSPAIEDWTEALVLYSDLQGGVKQHAWPERVEYVPEDCSTCNGRGKVVQTRFGQETTTDCPTCKGTGAAQTVYGVTRIKIDNRPGYETDRNYNSPIIYVEKSMEPLKFLNQKVQEHIQAGFEALNMAFLMDMPLAESGVAKQFDREELNAFLFSIAQHIKETILRPYFEFAYQMRYPERSYELPSIAIPDTFDILSATNLLSEIQFNNENGVGDRTTNRLLLKEYVNKRMQDQPEALKYNQATIDLDPMQGYTVEEIIALQGTVSQVDVYASLNIQTIIKLLADENAGFYELSYEQQRELVLQKAEEMAAARNVDFTSPEPEQATDDSAGTPQTAE